MNRVPLQAARNFRDLGGYGAGEGRSVRWRTLFRSGSMATLTGADIDALCSFGIRTIIDLRSTNERLREPTQCAGAFAPAMFAQDYMFESSDLGQALPTGQMESEPARQAFEQTYALLPFQFADQYREMFAQLLADRAPLIVNCSGGKDRTGVASALLLSALGVPRETIIEDYLLSRPGAALIEAELKDLSAHPKWGTYSPEVMEILRGVEARYLNAAFAAVEERHGAIEGYFRDRLGLSSADVERLQSAYLE